MKKQFVVIFILVIELLFVSELYAQKKEKIEIDSWMKLLECSKMKERDTLNLFMIKQKRNLL